MWRCQTVHVALSDGSCGAVRRFMWRCQHPSWPVVPVSLHCVFCLCLHSSLFVHAVATICCAARACLCILSATTRYVIGLYLHIACIHNAPMQHATCCTCGTWSKWCRQVLTGHQYPNRVQVPPSRYQCKGIKVPVQRYPRYQCKGIKVPVQMYQGTSAKVSRYQCKGIKVPVQRYQGTSAKVSGYQCKGIKVPVQRYPRYPNRVQVPPSTYQCRQVLTGHQYPNRVQEPPTTRYQCKTHAGADPLAILLGLTPSHPSWG